MELILRAGRALVRGSACIGLSVMFIGAMLADWREIRELRRRRRCQ